MNVPPKYKQYFNLLNLSPIALNILEKRYLLRDAEGKIQETPEEMFYRVAKNIAIADKNFGDDFELTEETFFKALIAQEIIPASPILMSAGGRLQFLFSDHALDVSDSLDSIFDTLKVAASIQQHGGGIGFNFSKIRPKFDDVSGLKNVAFGPLSVMKIFDTSFSAILQGGRRPGANMAILSVNHPDIEQFIDAKKDGNQLNNFNLSIAVTDDFIEAVLNDTDFNLINPRNNKIMKTIKATELFEKIAQSAWETGDPGMVFIDEMNRTYPFETRKVLCTGSCGQYELESYEGVPYTHINLTKILIERNGKKELDLEKLKDLVHIVVHFLDNCIDMHRFSNGQIEHQSKSVRKIGLGILGFADLLFSLGISYGSDESLEVIKEIMKVIKKESRKASKNLAFRRGTFPIYGQSSLDDPSRNATITSISPTGSTSMIAGVSQSIEPVYALSYTSKLSNGEEITILNSEFKKAIDASNLTNNEKVQLQFMDSLANIVWIDLKIKNIFKTSHDVIPEEHLKVMATFQRYIDNSISKTINLPNSANVDEIKDIFLKAYKLKCKGVTIYRDGCREDQVFLNKHQTKLYAFEN